MDASSSGSSAPLFLRAALGLSVGFLTTASRRLDECSDQEAVKPSVVAYDFGCECDRMTFDSEEQQPPADEQSITYHPTVAAFSAAAATMTPSVLDALPRSLRGDWDWDSIPVTNGSIIKALQESPHPDAPDFAAHLPPFGPDYLSTVALGGVVGLVHGLLDLKSNTKGDFTDRMLGRFVYLRLLPRSLIKGRPNAEAATYEETTAGGSGGAFDIWYTELLTPTVDKAAQALVCKSIQRVLERLMGAILPSDLSSFLSQNAGKAVSRVLGDGTSQATVNIFVTIPLIQLKYWFANYLTLSLWESLDYKITVFPGDAFAAFHSIGHHLLTDGLFAAVGAYVAGASGGGIGLLLSSLT